jgi:hypothetical protein
MALAEKLPVTLDFVDVRYKHPPLVDVFFDVALDNDASYARWFLLPTRLPSLPPEQDRRGGIEGVEVLRLAGKGRVVLGRFLGTRGFQALFVPAQAELNLRRLSFGSWTEAPRSFTTEAVIAKDVTIGGEPLRDWFGCDPLSDAHADVTLDQAQTIAERHTAGRSELPIVIIEGRNVELYVDLGK